MQTLLSGEELYLYKKELVLEEKSGNTIEKYLRDVRGFLEFQGENPLTREGVLRYKQHLQENYKLTSCNSMLAAVNHYLGFIGRSDCKVKAFKIQREMCRRGEHDLTKAEYKRLAQEARNQKKNWLCALMQTLCATGLRISEIPFVTVESLSTRRVQVNLKGKVRTVILPADLCRELRKYVNEKGIHSGSIFVTRTGKNLDRSNIWKAMKNLCHSAGVEDTKVFPHNFRHLFAVTFYKEVKDIVHLADILGHSNINTTRIYTLVGIEEYEKQLENLRLVM